MTDLRAAAHDYLAVRRQLGFELKHAGPSLFWTWRPSGSLYFMYQAGPRARSTRNT
jgi:hypothetical protein